jgi:hypothetical protein
VEENSARCSRTVLGGLLVLGLGLCHDRSPALHHMRASDQIDKLIISDFPYVLCSIRTTWLDSLGGAVGDDLLVRKGWSASAVR